MRWGFICRMREVDSPRLSATRDRGVPPGTITRSNMYGSEGSTSNPK
jgi:hypothetical protein